LNYPTQISDFLNLRSQFEIELLLGNYETARNIVNKVDNDICSSMWSIESRLILDEYQFANGKEQLNENSMVNFYVKCKNKALRIIQEDP
jgi:hypothetical protein